jgi:hypothetical protein
MLQQRTWDEPSFKLASYSPKVNDEFWVLLSTATYRELPRYAIAELLVF